jgi:hypothetical protein
VFLEHGISLFAASGSTTLRGLHGSTPCDLRAGHRHLLDGCYGEERGIREGSKGEMREEVPGDLSAAEELWTRSLSLSDLFAGDHEVIGDAVTDD